MVKLKAPRQNAVGILSWTKISLDKKSFLCIDQSFSYLTDKDY